MTKIFVAGHNGMVGSAITRHLQSKEVEVITASRQELDLTNQAEVKNFFSFHSFDQVYLAAAKVGGINANNMYPADFLYENMMIEANVIDSSHISGVQNLLFLGSSCIYPKHAEQPMRESTLLTGSLEPTNEPYAIAKIAGIKLCESYNRQFGRSYRSVMPTNLYGPGDNFHAENSHVIPGLIRRFHEAKVSGQAEVIAWGSGSPKREFLHVNDMAECCVHIMSVSSTKLDQHISEMQSHINIGTGKDCSIRELTQYVADVIGYTGEIIWDKSKPDGAPRKLLDVSRVNCLGWKSKIDLRDGLIDTYGWYVDNIKHLRV